VDKHLALTIGVTIPKSESGWASAMIKPPAMMDKLPFLSDDHHFAITQVAARSAQLDHMIELTAGELLIQTPHTAAVIVRNLTHDRLINVIEALLLDFFPKEADEHTRLIAQITRVRKERNNLMHWLWGKSDDPQAMKIGSLRPYRDNPPPKTLTAAQIQLLASEMLDSCNALHDWTQRNYERVTADLEQQRALREKFLQPALQARSASPPEQDPGGTGGLLGHLPLPSPK